jgi:hypothetical protein
MSFNQSENLVELSSKICHQISLYEHFYNFDVISVGKVFNYKAQKQSLSGYGASIDFLTKYDAKLAIETSRRRLLLGYSIKLTVAKPPMRLNGTWDSHICPASFYDTGHMRHRLYYRSKVHNEQTSSA